MAGRPGVRFSIIDTGDEIVLKPAISRKTTVLADVIGCAGYTGAVKLITPALQNIDLDIAYSAMASDSVREQDVLEWSNGVVGDSAHEKR